MAELGFALLQPGSLALFTEHSTLSHSRLPFQGFTSCRGAKSTPNFPAALPGLPEALTTPWGSIPEMQVLETKEPLKDQPIITPQEARDEQTGLRVNYPSLMPVRINPFLLRSLKHFM